MKIEQISKLMFAIAALITALSFAWLSLAVTGRFGLPYYPVMRQDVTVAGDSPVGWPIKVRADVDGNISHY
jgi:hypothetical protein